MKFFSGICASEGSAIGPILRIKHTRLALNRKVDRAEHELKAFENASNLAIKQLVSFCKQKQSEREICEIFDTQRFILTDDSLTKEVHNYIKAGASAAAAVERAGNIFANNLRRINDNYFSERSTDVLDICNRVVKILDGETTHIKKPITPSILVSEEIYPTDIACLNRSDILGIITSNGSVNSHAAIIARSFNIPFIVMAGTEFLHFSKNENAYINSKSTSFYIYNVLCCDNMVAQGARSAISNNGS